MLTTTRALAMLVLLAGWIIALPQAESEEGPAAVGEPAPGLTITATFNNGDTAIESLSDLRGKVVLLDFWATWCAPCIVSMPKLNAWHDTYADDGLVIVGHTDGSSQNLEAFIADKELRYPITQGPDLGDSFGVVGVPAAFLIDHEGIIRWAGLPSKLEDATITDLLEKLPE